MLIEALSLSDFRNIHSLYLEPSPGLNVITGENAQGKTNTLESICYLSLISSFRGAKDAELVRFGADSACIEARAVSDERMRQNYREVYNCAR